MILLNDKDLNNRKALEERKNYLLSLLEEPRPHCSPSSQEWVSPEYWSGHRTILENEVREINEALGGLTE